LQKQITKTAVTRYLLHELAKVSFSENPVILFVDLFKIAL
jgi:hypothetical protein